MSTPRTLVRRALAASAIPLLLLVLASVASANALGRDRDPLVLTGSALPTLLGTAPGRIVAFRRETAWVQVPVQVDERKVEDFGTIYGMGPLGLTVLTYVDASTFTGADLDAGFDADDELVLMGREAGARAGVVPPPAGVLPGTGVELAITNSLTGATAYVYLFETDGSLAPAAGAPDIGYVFHLLSGDYLTTYDTVSGPNPEDSRVTTSAYSVHFSDRWIRDETAVFSGGAPGVDLLDRHKSLFAPGNCVRSEETFSNGEGAFLVNRVGPVRALRGYVGANSGVTTYRVHWFYEEREDLTTYLRVHPVSGIVDYFDYDPAASGMTYANDLNPAGVPVDGSPDLVAPGPFAWEMVTGNQGTIAQASILHTDIPGFDYSSYYSDTTVPPFTQCTGDAFEYGASGFWEQDPIPNTDPSFGFAFVLELTRAIAYGPPSQSATFAQDRATEAVQPLTAVASPFGGATAVAGIGSDAGPRISIVPNPASRFALVEVRQRVAGPLDVRIHDVAGRVVATPLTGYRGPGVHSVRLDLSSLSAGTYFVRVVGAGGSASRRWVLLK